MPKKASKSYIPRHLKMLRPQAEYLHGLLDEIDCLPATGASWHLMLFPMHTKPTSTAMEFLYPMKPISWRCPVRIHSDLKSYCILATSGKGTAESTDPLTP